MARHYGSILTMPKKALATRFCKKARKGSKLTQKACVRAAMKLPTMALIQGVLDKRSAKAKLKRPYVQTRKGPQRRTPKTRYLPDWL